jgi:hypothetical protein
MQTAISTPAAEGRSNGIDTSVIDMVVYAQIWLMRLL